VPERKVVVLQASRAADVQSLNCCRSKWWQPIANQILALFFLKKDLPLR